MKFTEDKKQLIITHYPAGDLDWLCSQTSQTRNSLKEYARKLGLKRTKSRSKGNLVNLLNKTLESYYWLGLFLSDGYISQKGHFMLTQNEKDKNQVFKLAKFLETKVYEFQSKKSYKNCSRTYRVNLYDSIIGPRIRTMFQIIGTKTKNGVDLTCIPDGIESLALLIGIADGDGYFNNGIRIECYESWEKVFKQLIPKLPSEYQDISVYLKYKKTHKKFYCNVRIKKNICFKLFKFIQTHNLPTNERKWSVIR